MKNKIKILVEQIKAKNYRMARSTLKRIVNGRRSVKLYDNHLEDCEVKKFLLDEFNKHADKMNASFWQTDGAYPDWNDNAYEIKYLSEKDSYNIAKRFNKEKVCEFPKFISRDWWED